MTRSQRIGQEVTMARRRVALPPRVAQPMNEVIFQVLKDHILRQVFKDGMVLRQGSIARAFGVGRQPVSTALRKLEGEGLIRKRNGHGFVVGTDADGSESRPKSLRSAGLVLPAGLEGALERRKLKEDIYPQVERAVAACLVFGRFRINKSTLSEYFGVSRTVAHEVLMGLESVGFAWIGRNGRWYVGPLTLEGLKECFEIRWLLEPEALRQAAPAINREELLSRRAHLEAVWRRARFEPEEMIALETELHNDLVLRRANNQMKRILTRCQLPIITTYETVSRDPARSGHEPGFVETLDEHTVVLDRLIDGDVEAAARGLEGHLHHAFELCTPHFRNLPPLPKDKIPPYMSLES